MCYILQCVPVVASEKTVLGAAVAQTMVPVTLSMGPVSVTQAGSAVTALSVSFLWHLCNNFNLSESSLITTSKVFVLSVFHSLSPWSVGSQLHPHL